MCACACVCFAAFFFPLKEFVQVNVFQLWWIFGTSFKETNLICLWTAFPKDVSFCHKECVPRIVTEKGSGDGFPVYRGAFSVLGRQRTDWMVSSPLPRLPSDPPQSRSPGPLSAPLRMRGIRGRILCWASSSESTGGREVCRTPLFRESPLHPCRAQPAGSFWTSGQPPSFSSSPP